MEIADWDFLGSPYDILRGPTLVEHFSAFGTSGFSGPGTWADKFNALTILDRPEMNASLHVKTPEDPERSEKGFRRICKASNDCSILGILRDPWWKSRVSDYQKMLQS